MPDTERSTRRWSERTTADLASLLVELGRTVRGLSFYREGDPACRDLVDRLWLALHGELSRAGPIELWVDAGGFRASGIREAVPLHPIEDLAEALRRHAVERVRLSDGLSRESLQAFVELLSRPAAPIRQGGGIAIALAHRSNAGIVLNGGEDEAVATRPRLVDTPATPSPSLGAALLARSHRLIVEPRGGGEKYSVDERPLEAAAADARGERLLFRLIELDRCTDDAAYEFLGRRIVDWATELFEAGLRDECHRAILVLADHAVGSGGRSGLQARVAQRLCVALASGARLQALIDRAQSGDTRARVRAAQVLLQLGEHAIPAIFDRIASSASAESSAQLTATLIALGDAAIGHLTRVIGGVDEARAGLAIRLAGELQHPALARPLIAALDGERAGLRREAARSLAHLGGDDAVHALVNALTSEREDLPEIAVHWLGVLRDPRGVQPLLGALERATRSGDVARAREVVRALGALGSERATPRLVALLERRSLLRRKALREIQIAALGALESLPGREARRAIERARRHRDPVVRERASRLLTMGDRSSPSANA